jgi:nitronate monooxygenase
MPHACEVPISPQPPADDLIDWLRMLMRAERAGARLMLDSARETDDPALLLRLEQLHHGEAESCRRLRHCLERLGAKPGAGMGEFHAKAMAISNLQERLLFIARGQRWVARQLQARLPQIEQPWLRKELEVVLYLHQGDR